MEGWGGGGVFSFHPLKGGACLRGGGGGGGGGAY